MTTAAPAQILGHSSQTVAGGFPHTLAGKQKQEEHKIIIIIIMIMIIMIIIIKKLIIIPWQLFFTIDKWGE